jgi:Mn-containing catalase
MLTGASDSPDGSLGDALSGARTPATSSSSRAVRRHCPWTRWAGHGTGDYVYSSGDLLEDLTHNFFLETGARSNKLKVYEMSAHPAARALTGYLLVRGGCTSWPTPGPSRS